MTPNPNPGKLGLALSGGGFRAALFHIGMLADLAERDLLRETEVLSTVSGGSIVGALYYLKIKELLEGKRKDSDLENPEYLKQVYIHIIREMESEFLYAVQKNIRMRTFLNIYRNIKMVRADYSRSDRISELYTQYIYQPVWDSITGSKGTDILLKDLKIIPDKSLWPKEALELKDFDLTVYQKHASHKIPVLIINSTSLNTGHCWQFTATWTGEKQDPTLAVPDPNSVLPVLYYDDPSLSHEQRNKLYSLQLGHAVAASACVPAIFKPLAIHNLYHDKKAKEYIVQLVDGGVYDNQGLFTILQDQNCTRVLCSDASLQSVNIPKPGTGTFSVFQQANDIMMDRIRDYELKTLFKPEYSPRVFLHLKDHESASLHPDNEKNKRIIEALSCLRTDLDSFSENEAYSLMYLGYKMSGQHAGVLNNSASKTSADWNFLAIENKILTRYSALLKQLKVGSQKAYKVFALSWLTLAVTILVLLACLALVIFRIYNLQEIIDIDLSGPRLVFGISVCMALAVILALRGRIQKIIMEIPVIKEINYATGQVLIFPLALLIVIPVSILVRIHLWVYDSIFLRIGRK